MEENKLQSFRKEHGTFCVREACENFLRGAITEIKHDVNHAEDKK